MSTPTTAMPSRAIHPFIDGNGRTGSPTAMTALIAEYLEQRLQSMTEILKKKKKKKTRKTGRNKTRTIHP